MNAFFMIVQRDLLLVMRRKSEVLTALFFFVIVTSLFPLGIGADTALLRKIAPGVIYWLPYWVYKDSLQVTIKMEP